MCVYEKKRGEEEGKNKFYLCHSLLRKVSGVIVIKSSGAIYSELIYFCIYLYHTHKERDIFF
jgi:hypothetical protein